RTGLVCACRTASQTTCRADRGAIGARTRDAGWDSRPGLRTRPCAVASVPDAGPVVEPDDERAPVTARHHPRRAGSVRHRVKLEAEPQVAEAVLHRAGAEHRARR